MRLPENERILEVFAKNQRSSRMCFDPILAILELFSLFFNEKDTKKVKRKIILKKKSENKVENKWKWRAPSWSCFLRRSTYVLPCFYLSFTFF